MFDAEFGASFFDGFLSSQHKAAIAKTTGPQEGHSVSPSTAPGETPGWHVRAQNGKNEA
jgi:hypothetical protein